MDNYDKYVQFGLNLNWNVGNSGRPRAARTEANIDMVRRALEAHPLSKTQFLTINTCSSTVVWLCAPAIFV